MVTVTGPKYIVSDFNEISEGNYFEAQVYHDVTSESERRNNNKVYNRIKDTLFYNIGIKDLESLMIVIGDGSKVTANAPVQLNDLKIFMEGTSHIDAELNCESLNIKTSDNSHIRFQGTAKEADISLEDNSIVECYGLNIQDAEVMLGDNSKLELNIRRNIRGIIMDLSLIHI